MSSSAWGCREERSYAAPGWSYDLPPMLSDICEKSSKGPRYSRSPASPPVAAGLSSGRPPHRRPPAIAGGPSQAPAWGATVPSGTVPTKPIGHEKVLEGCGCAAFPEQPPVVELALTGTIDTRGTICTEQKASTVPTWVTGPRAGSQRAWAWRAPAPPPWCGGADSIAFKP